MSRISKIIQFLKNSEKQAYQMRSQQYNRRKIRNILKTHPELDQPLKPETVRQIQDLFGTKEPLHWHKAYSAFNGVEDYCYLPEDLFYNRIEPALNHVELTRAYSDKNNYRRLFKDLREPEMILKNVWGRFYDSSDRALSRQEAINLLREHTGDLLIKPSIESGGGRNILFLEKDTDYDSLFSQYKRDFLIQKNLEQVDELSQIHANSLNTLRILTYRHANSVSTLSTVVRFGRGTSRLDNQTTGGISCGLKNGQLNSFGVDKFGGKYKFHPDSKKKFAGHIIPGANKAQALAYHLHGELDHFRLVSWDMAIGKDGLPYLIEMNLRYQEINFHQFNNGPVFKTLIEDGLIPFL